VARIGGDEFCVLLEGADSDVAVAVGQRVLARLAAGRGRPLTVSCGAASMRGDQARAGDLLRAADAAQYTAKRSGRNRVCVAVADLDERLRVGGLERRAIRGRASTGSVDVGSLLADALDALDGPARGRPALDRLEVVALAAGRALDASAVAVSWRAAGSAVIETLFVHDWRTQSSAGRRFGTGGEAFEADAFPLSAQLLAEGGAFVVLADDETADRSERELLAEYGMAGLLAAAAAAPDGGAWLVEIFADGGTRELGDAEPSVRLLVAEAVRGAAQAPLRAVG
jgi:hypothetical protein